MENPTKMDDLGVPLFLETLTSRYLKYADDFQRVFISLHSVTNSSTENAIGKACPDLEYAVMRHNCVLCFVGL